MTYINKDDPNEWRQFRSFLQNRGIKDEKSSDEILGFVHEMMDAQRERENKSEQIRDDLQSIIDFVGGTDREISEYVREIKSHY